MKVHRGNRGIAPLILNLDTKWWWMHSLMPWLLSCSHWIGGWVDPRAGLDGLEKDRNLLFLPGFESQTVQPVALLLYWICYPGYIHLYYKWSGLWSVCASLIIHDHVCALCVRTGKWHVYYDIVGNMCWHLSLSVWHMLIVVCGVN
jgi:hypothetical protein